MEMQSTRLDTLIFLWKESKDNRILTKLIHTYGYRVLLSMGEEGVSFYVDSILVPGKEYLLYDINIVDLLRRVYDFIYNKFFYYNDVDFNNRVCRFLHYYRFDNPSNHYIRKENSKFITKMITSIMDESDDDNYIDWHRDIVDSIVNNPTIEFDFFKEICREYPELFVELIKRMMELKPIDSIDNIIITLNDIKDELTLVSETSNSNVKVEHILEEGISELIKSSVFQTNAYYLISNLKYTDTFKLKKYKEMYQQFFYLYITENKVRIENLKEIFMTEFESSGIYPIGFITSNINYLNEDAIFYILLFGSDAKERIANYFNYNGEYRAHIDNILEGFELLYLQDIIPKYFMDIDRWEQDILLAHNSEDDNSSSIEPFNLDDFLDGNI